MGSVRREGPHDDTRMRYVDTPYQCAPNYVYQLSPNGYWILK